MAEVNTGYNAEILHTPQWKRKRLTNEKGKDWLKMFRIKKCWKE